MITSIEITGNGQSEYLDLYTTSSKVTVYYVGAAAGTLTPQGCKRKGEEIDTPLPDDSATITASTQFIVHGPGYLSFDASGVSGTIKVDIDEAV